MSFSYLVYWRYSEEKNMKKTNKTRLGTNLKRGMSLGLSIVMTFAVLMANGCDKAETIEDYPEVQVIVDDETDNVDVSEVIEDEEVVVAKETIDRGYDSIYDTGTFVFNPEAVNPAIKEEMKNKETSYQWKYDDSHSWRNAEGSLGLQTCIYNFVVNADALIPMDVLTESKKLVEFRVGLGYCLKHTRTNK